MNVTNPPLSASCTKLIAGIPQVPAPGPRRICSDEPPIAEVPDALIDKHSAVITGIAGNEIHASDQHPHRCFHYQVQRYEQANHAPAKDAHSVAKGPSKPGDKSPLKRPSTGCWMRSLTSFPSEPQKPRIPASLSFSALPQPPKQRHHGYAKYAG